MNSRCRTVCFTCAARWRLRLRALPAIASAGRAVRLLRVVRLRLALATAMLATWGATAQSGVTPTNLPSFKPFMGIGYGPFRGAESPNYNSYPTLAEISQDLTNSLIFLASEISTYGMDNTLSNIPSLCNLYNVRCYPCAYVSAANLSDTTNQLNALIAVGNYSFPTTRGLVVGSESILQGYSPATLISNLNYVRAATHTNVPVGTRDLPANFINNPALVAACDFIQADIYAYWAQIPVSNAAAWTIQQWQALTNAYPGKRVEIGEANWPAGGSNTQWSNAAVVPSVANQGRFLSDFVGLASSNHLEYFIFELRDEPWKVQEGVGTVETNWGILDGSGNKKQSLLNYLTANFTLAMLPARSNQQNVVVHTYEANPYSVFATTNLAGSWGNPITNFTAALGTNQTVIMVTNISSQKFRFYKAAQGF